jgi:hypothetical protein
MLGEDWGAGDCYAVVEMEPHCSASDPLGWFGSRCADLISERCPPARFVASYCCTNIDLDSA